MTYATLLQIINAAIAKNPDLANRSAVIYDSTTDTYHWANPAITKTDKDGEFAIGF
jgi:hypothetical protein